MKRLVYFSLACVTILLTAFISTSLVSQHANAASGSIIQMRSGTFSDQDISFTKTAALSIPFSVSTTGKLEATSLMSAIANPPTFHGTINCELDLDNVSFFSTSSVYGYGMTYSSLDITGVATKIAPGSHTFSVACYFASGESAVTLHSLGTSLIITG